VKIAGTDHEIIFDGAERRAAARIAELEAELVLARAAAAITDALTPELRAVLAELAETKQGLHLVTDANRRLDARLDEMSEMGEYLQAARIELGICRERHERALQQRDAECTAHALTPGRLDKSNDVLAVAQERITELEAAHALLQQQYHNLSALVPELAAELARAGRRCGISVGA